MSACIQRKWLLALRRPDKVLRYVFRLARNWRFRTSDPYAFYSQVVDHNAKRDADQAIGSDSREHWLTFGQFQFDYLLRQGMTPKSKVLEIGCGNLRLGWRLIEWLDPGNYVGLDISEAILASARSRVEEFRLADKHPSLFLVSDANYDFLQDDYFDIVNAHAVFTQVPMKVIREVLRSVRRVMKADGFFDFTYHLSQGSPYDYLGEDFFYPEAMILDAVRDADMIPVAMADWQYSQPKIRAYKTPPRFRRDPSVA